MNANCPKCRQESRLHLRIGDLNRRITDAIFDYYCCSACGIIFLWPVPNDLSKYYPNDYYCIPISREAFIAAAELERYKIDIVRRFASHGRLLEIGPAYGSFTYLAKQAGFEAYAIEMDEACCRFMNEVVGVRAIHSLDTDSALRASSPFDVIALWHVVEHLADPWSTLALIAQRLELGGVLVVAAPNPDAFQFRVLGRYWTHLDAPRHLELIPSGTLSDHVQRLGLVPLLITTTDEGSLGWNDFGWGMSLANFSDKRYIRKGLRLIGSAISRVLAPLERVNGRGSAYTAVFRRERRA
jgi:SAM-dependent methyltransferase